MVKLILELLQFAVVIASSILLIKATIMRRKTNYYVEKIKKQHEDNEKILSKNEKFIVDINERLNLLSRENVKLRQQNEEMKDKLRNLGIKYFD